jgi:hypothetical protein
METLTRLVSESLARHGFDRPLDYRRLQWSRWFRCESHHSLLFVPSKPGIFALAEEIMNLGSEANPEGHGFSRAARNVTNDAALAPEGSDGRKAQESRRMLAVTQFFEADDMAFVLDRMLSRTHSMHSRLESGRYFVRYVEIQDEIQRRNICNALNQWIVSSSEKATGIGSHFATSLELTPANEQSMSAGRAPARANADRMSAHVGTAALGHSAEQSSTGAAPEVYRSPLFPSGF